MLKLSYIIYSSIAVLGSFLYSSPRLLSDADAELRGIFGLINPPCEKETFRNLSRCSTPEPSKLPKQPRKSKKTAISSSFPSKCREYDTFEQEILKQPTPIRAVNHPLPGYTYETPQERPAPDDEFSYELIKDRKTATGATLREYRITNNESEIFRFVVKIERHLHIAPEQYCKIFNQILELAETNSTFTTKYQTPNKLKISASKIIQISEDEELKEDPTAFISCKISGPKNSGYRKLSDLAAHVCDEEVLRYIRQTQGKAFSY